MRKIHDCTGIISRSVLSTFFPPGNCFSLTAILPGVTLIERHSLIINDEPTLTDVCPERILPNHDFSPSQSGKICKDDHRLSSLPTKSHVFDSEIPAPTRRSSWLHVVMMDIDHRTVKVVLLQTNFNPCTVVHMPRARSRFWSHRCARLGVPFEDFVTSCLR